MPLIYLWSKNWGVAFCKQVMSRNRFKETLRFLRFDKNRVGEKGYESTSLISFRWYGTDLLKTVLRAKNLEFFSR